MNHEKFPGIKEYLDSSAVTSVEAWAKPVLSLIARNSVLQQVDLVVEGGIGRGQTMPHVIRRLFPYALYVGTDLSRHMFNKGRKINEVDEATIKEIISANLHPSIPMDGAIIRANCFDAALVTDIAKKTDSHVPMLVSWRALNAYLNDGLSAQEDKIRDDETGLEHIVSPTSPYSGQLYLAEFPLREDNVGIEGNAYLPAYGMLEQAAQRYGWSADIEDDWLLLYR